MARYMFFPNETFEQMRERMTAETVRFIEWGLAHPKRVPWIPLDVAGRRDYSERVKKGFWNLVWTYRGLPR